MVPLADGVLSSGEAVAEKFVRRIEGETVFVGLDGLLVFSEMVEREALSLVA